MGNASAKKVESDSEEEYCVLNISYDNLLRFSDLMKKDDLETFKTVLQDTKTVDTDSFLEFTDALIAVKDDVIYTLKGKRECPPGKDPFEALMESGYVISMLEYAQEIKAKKITQWLSDSIESEKFEVDLSANPLVDLDSLAPKDFAGLDIDKIHVVSVDSPDIYRLPNLGEILSSSGMAFFIMGVSGKCSSLLKAKIKNIVNMTAFEDETKENGVPFIDCDDPEEFKKYTFITTISSRLDYCRDLDLIQLADIVSPEYHECLHSFKKKDDQPKILRPGENGWQPKNKRTIRTISKGILGMSATVQLQFTEMPIDKINKNIALSDGITWDKAILAERTKQNIKNKDSTAKMKSITLMKQLPDSVLITTTSITANTMAPVWLVNAGKEKSKSKAYTSTKGICKFYMDAYPTGRKPKDWQPTLIVE